MHNKKYLIFILLAFFCIGHSEVEAKCRVSFSFFANFLQPPQPVMIAPVPAMCQPIFYQQPMCQPVICQPVQYAPYAVPVVPCYVPCGRTWGNPVRYAPY